MGLWRSPQPWSLCKHPKRQSWSLHHGLFLRKQAVYRHQGLFPLPAGNMKSQISVTDENNARRNASADSFGLSNAFYFLFFLTNCDLKQIIPLRSIHVFLNKKERVTHVLCSFRGFMLNVCSCSDVFIHVKVPLFVLDLSCFCFIAFFQAKLNSSTKNNVEIKVPTCFSVGVHITCCYRCG